MWLRIVSAILLSLGTAVFSIGCDRYEIIGENLLQNPRFLDNFTGWQVQKTDSVSAQQGVLTLSNPVRGNRNSISVKQAVAIPSGQRLLFLSCEVRSTDVVSGTKPWQSARVVIVPLTSEGKARHDVPHVLALLHGTTPWARFAQVFRVPDENTEVAVVVQLLNASGTLDVRSVSLRFALENPAYTKWRYALVQAWLMVGLWIAWPLLRTARRDIGKAGVVVVCSVILVGILMPASVKDAMTPSWLTHEREAQGPFRADLRVAPPFRYALLPSELNIYKLAHLLLFAVIGYLLVFQRPYGIPISAQFGIIALFALATESMQVLASGRNGSLSDVLIDLFGACCGLLVAAAIHRHYCQNPNMS